MWDDIENKTSNCNNPDFLLGGLGRSIVMTTLTKPVSRRAHVRVPHGVRPEIIVTIYPGGELGLREAGRPSRTEQRLDLGTLYVAAIKSAVRRSENRASEYVRKNGWTWKAARQQARKENGL